MKFLQVNALREKDVEILFLPFIQEKAEAKKVFVLDGFDEAYKFPVDSSDFTAKEGEITLLYQVKGLKRVALLGLGPKDKVSVESLRRVFAACIKYCRQKQYENIHIAFPILPFSQEEVCRGMGEGLLLANYAFEHNRFESLQKNQASLVKKAIFLALPKGSLALFEKYTYIAEGVFLARDLVNGNADDITPEALSFLALQLEERFSQIKTKVLNRKAIEKEKMGLLLAVARGSYRDPAFIVMEYKGNPKSKEHTVVVCKGVTFDTGGLLIKPRGGMEDMRSDMAGAACGFGTLLSVVLLKMKVNVSIVIGATENAIGPNAYKPGDVYKSMSGKTVEITDTDAEGRLVLADAITYTEKYLKPTRIVDVATLTGAMMVALGEEVAGICSNNKELEELLIHAGNGTYERVWPLPLCEEYKEHLKSDIADLKNTGTKYARAISAALFIQEFVAKTPWAHLDIAGPAFYTKERHYIPKNGTGYGVRLLIEFLELLH
ncbi:MAG: leucyl aminopeptidase [Chlamydiales bacterium]|nr:leucyl aminopeptidase [Chlamydiales bacterium]